MTDWETYDFDPVFGLMLAEIERRIKMKEAYKRLTEDDIKTLKKIQRHCSYKGDQERKNYLAKIESEFQRNKAKYK
jgi:hypothetical protein